MTTRNEDQCKNFKIVYGGITAEQEELIDSLMCDGKTYNEAFEIVTEEEILTLRDGYYD